MPSEIFYTRIYTYQLCIDLHKQNFIELLLWKLTEIQNNLQLFVSFSFFRQKLATLRN